MANLSHVFQGGFDAATVEPAQSRDFSAMPAGPYDSEITSSDVRDTKKGDGQYLEVEFTVISPAQYAGRKVWSRINLTNPSAEAQRIGRAELSALCRAAGVPNLQDSDQLFQKIVRIRLKVDRQEGREPRNEVTGFESHAGSQLPATAAHTPATPAARPAAAPRAAATPPWAKK